MNEAKKDNSDNYIDIDSKRGFRQFIIAIVRFLQCILFRVHYHGLENIPDRGPLLLTANHTSMLDIVVILTRVKPWIYWVGKRELTKAAVGRLFFSWWGMIPVDRKKLDLHTAKMMLHYLQSGKVIGIFPEATRVPHDADLRDYPPSTGTAHFAVRNNIPILPVAISGRFKLGGRIDVTFGEPYQLNVSKDKIKQSSNEMSYYIMQKIYSLKQEKYPECPIINEKKCTDYLGKQQSDDKNLSDLHAMSGKQDQLIKDEADDSIYQ